MTTPPEPRHDAQGQEQSQGAPGGGAPPGDGAVALCVFVVPQAIAIVVVAIRAELGRSRAHAGVAVVAIVATTDGIAVTVAVGVRALPTIGVRQVRGAVAIVVRSVGADLDDRGDLAVARAPPTLYTRAQTRSAGTDGLGGRIAGVAALLAARGAGATIVEVAVAVLVNGVAADLGGGSARHRVAGDRRFALAPPGAGACARAGTGAAGGSQLWPRLVGLPVAVVIPAVAHLRCARMDTRAPVVAVRIGAGRADPVAVAVVVGVTHRGRGSHGELERVEIDAEIGAVGGGVVVVAGGLQTIVVRARIDKANRGDVPGKEVVGRVGGRGCANHGVPEELPRVEPGVEGRGALPDAVTEETVVTRAEDVVSEDQLSDGGGAGGHHGRHVSEAGVVHDDDVDWVVVLTEDLKHAADALAALDAVEQVVVNVDAFGAAGRTVVVLPQDVDATPDVAPDVVANRDVASDTPGTAAVLIPRGDQQGHAVLPAGPVVLEPVALHQRSFGVFELQQVLDVRPHALPASNSSTLIISKP